MKPTKTLTLATLLVVALSGCATRGSNYVPLVDLKNKSESTFNSDVLECQQYAKKSLDAAAGAAVGAIAGALLAAALMPRGYRNMAAQQGAIAGGVAGGAGANQTQESIVKRCLAGRGYNVLN